MTDAALNTPSYRENGEGFGLTAASMKRFWELYLDGADGAQPDASPLRAGDLRGLPPAFVLTVARRRAARRGRGLRGRAGGGRACRSTLRRYDGAMHGFFRWIAKAEIGRRAVAEVGAALRAGTA